MQSGSDTLKYNYDQAIAECQKIGSGLATIKNASDYDAFITIIQNSGLLLPEFPSLLERIWISGKKEDGIWRWHDGEAIPEPWYWHTNQPGFDGGCARVNTENNGIRIKNFECSPLFYQMLCE